MVFMKVKFLIFAGVLLANPTYANVLELEVALNNVRNNCSGISEELAPMKKLAGINTAVTGVGTLAGGGAIATGFVKQSKDKEIARLELAKLRAIEQKQSATPTNASSSDILSTVGTYYEQHKNDTPRTNRSTN